MTRRELPLVKAKPQFPRQQSSSVASAPSRVPSESEGNTSGSAELDTTDESHLVRGYN